MEKKQKKGVKMNRSKNIWNKNILIFMFGILVAIGIAFPLANESVSYKEVPTSKLVRYGHGWEHIENNKQSIYIQKDNAEIKYYFEGKMEDWFYREFYISGLYSYENIVAEVCFYDESGNEIARSVEYWGNGRNIVSNPVGNYRFIIIRFYHQENASFIMEGMRLLKTLPQVHKKKMLLYFIIIFSIYIMLFYTLAKQKKIRSISKKIFSEIYSCEKDLYKVLNKIKMRKNSSIERIILWGILILLIAGAEYRLQIGSKYIIRYLELFIFAGTILLGRSYFNLYEKNIEVDENKRIFYF